MGAPPGLDTGGIFQPLKLEGLPARIAARLDRNDESCEPYVWGTGGTIHCWNMFQVRRPVGKLPPPPVLPTAPSPEPS